MGLNCVVADDRYPDGTRLSMARFRTLFSSLCLVATLRAPMGNLRAICSCTLFMRQAECAHELFVRWLNADPAVVFGQLRAQTRGEGNINPQQLETTMRLRATGVGRPVNIPAAAALSTMDAIRDRAKKRSDAIRASTKAEKEKVWQHFGTPQDGQGDDVSKAELMVPGAARSAKLRSVAFDLKSRLFPVYFSALLSVETLRVTVAEGKEFGIGELMTHFIRNSPMPSKALCHKIVKRWQSEARASAAPHTGGSGAGPEESGPRDPKRQRTGIRGVASGTDGPGAASSSASGSHPLGPTGE